MNRINIITGPMKIELGDIFELSQKMFSESDRAGICKITEILPYNRYKIFWIEKPWINRFFNLDHEDELSERWFREPGARYLGTQLSMFNEK
jgi:hypothetical protein